MIRLFLIPLAILLPGGPVFGTRFLLAQKSPSLLEVANAIKIQAESMELQAKSRLADGEARVFNAEAAGVEILNASEALNLKTKTIQRYFSDKKMRNLEKWDQLEQKLESARMPMVEKQARRVIVSERTLSEDDLDEIRPGIRSGDLINRLFMHINSENGLTYGESLSPSFTSRLKPFSVATLQSLRFSRASKYGQVPVSLSESMPEILDLWPYAFFEPPLQPHVSMVTESAKNMFIPGLSMQRKYELAKVFQEKLEALQREFLRVYPPTSYRQMPTIQVRRILAAEDFLNQVERVVQTRAEENTSIAGEIPAYMTKYPADQRNIATLIQYTQRYGLELQPAILGSEHHYDQLFEETRNFYILTDSAPTRDSLLAPIMNLDLDAEIKDAPIEDVIPKPALRPADSR